MACNVNRVPTTDYAVPAYSETGTTYYVNFDSGSDASSGLTVDTAWKTINKLNTSLSGGDTAVVWGTATDTKTLQPPNGTDGAPTVVKARSGFSAILQNTEFNVQIWCPPRSWLVFDGLVVEAVAGVSKQALITSGGSHIWFRNCHFDGKEIATVGINLNAHTDARVDNCTFDNCGTRDANNAGDHLFVQNGADRCIISRNTLLNAGHAAMTIGGYQTSENSCDGMVVYRNYVRNHWAGGINANGKTTNSIIAGNSCLSSAASKGGFDPGSETGIFIQGSNNTVHSNTCYWNAEHGIKLQANAAISSITAICSDNHVFNNSCYSNGGAALMMVVSNSRDASLLSNNVIENNIFYGNSTQGAVYNDVSGYWDSNARFHHIWVAQTDAVNPWGADSLGSNTIRNNLFSRVSGTADLALLLARTAGNGGTITYSTASFNNASSFANEDTSGNRWETDPLWTDPDNADFTLTSTSTAIDAGVILAGWSAGSDYCNTAPDLGAFEFDNTGGGGGGGSKNTMVETVACAPPDTTPCTAAAVDVQ